MPRAPKDATTLEDAREPLAAPVAAASRIRVVQSPDTTQRDQIHALEASRDILAVGRDAGDGQLSIADPRMSRLHARIAWDAAARAFRFGDAGSANGCYLNGVRSASAPLAHGDVLRFGDTLLVVERSTAGTDWQETVARVAPTTLTVLLTGETGTGKEVVARRIHALSGRQGKFVPVNCAALSPELVTAELFGHTRGAFSNATQARTGLFMAAEDGTLLLDEVGDLPLEQQPALLRVLQESAVRPVGSDREVPSNARVVAATHVDLTSAARTGAFRPDLLARLTQCAIHVPALRERRGDILALAREFAEGSGERLEISADAAERLLLWHWPLNIRELQHLIEAFSVFSPGRRLDIAYLRERHPSLLEASPAAPADPHATRRQELQRLLAESSGNVSAVARTLGKPRAQIYRWLKRYGMMPNDGGESSQ